MWKHTIFTIMCFLAFYHNIINKYVKVGSERQSPQRPNKMIACHFTLSERWLIKEPTWPLKEVIYIGGWRRLIVTMLGIFIKNGEDDGWNYIKFVGKWTSGTNDRSEFPNAFVNDNNIKIIQRSVISFSANLALNYDISVCVQFHVMLSVRFKLSG
jgi:hypothetical protein